MKYEVTIGIPLFKAVDYIKRSLMSAIEQSFPSIEFMIVDDCGEDGSMDIVESLKESHVRGNDIHIIKNPQNLGVGYSRNRIIEEAQGRYLYFMDSDDTIEPYTIHLLMEKIQQHHAQIAYGSYEIVDEIQHIPTRQYVKPSMLLYGEGELAMYAFKYKDVFHFSVCNSLMETEYLRQTEMRFVDAPFWEDMVFTLGLVTKVRCAVMLSNVTYHYLRHPGSLSHYQNREQFDKDEIMKNVGTINYLKQSTIYLKDKHYFPDLCLYLEMNSFYIVCHILKQYHRIFPRITYSEMRQIVRHPIQLYDILQFKHKLLQNLLMWALGVLPIPAFKPSIWLLGKIKRAI